MSKFPWEQSGSKKVEDPHTTINTGQDVPPFAAEVSVPDILQKAFSEGLIQETTVSHLSSETPPSKPPSFESFPPISEGVLDLNSLQSDKNSSSLPIKPLTINEKNESLPPFLSEGPSMLLSDSTLEIKDKPKVTTPKKKPLPVFEIETSDNDLSGDDPIFSSIKGNNDGLNVLTLSSSGTNTKKQESFTDPTFSAPSENIISSFPKESPFIDSMASSENNTNPPESAEKKLSQLQASIPSNRPNLTGNQTNITGLDNPFDSIPQNNTGSPFPGFPSSFKESDSSVINSSSAERFSPQEAKLSVSPDPFNTVSDKSPFADNVPSCDPFASLSNPNVGGSAPFGSVPFQPSGVNAQFSGNLFPGSMNTLQGKKTVIISKIDDISKNLATGVTDLANFIFSNVRHLTKGQSLLEKMEKIKEGKVYKKVNTFQEPQASAYQSGIKAKESLSEVSYSSPFEAGSAFAPPFVPDGSADVSSLSAFQSSRPDITKDDDFSKFTNDFVKVTPVEKPLYDFPEALKVDSAPQPKIPAFDEKMKVTENGSNNTGNCRFNNERTEGSLSSGIRSSVECASVSSKDLDDIREKLELSAANIAHVYEMYEELSDKLSAMGDSVQSLQSSSENIVKATGLKFDNLEERIVQLESHLSGIEQQVSHVQSENSSFISSLNIIEKHISELVDSYTALVSKMQENAQETDERLSVLSGRVGSMENFVQRIANMEKSGAEMSLAVQDMQGNVSKLMQDISNVSAAQAEIKDQMQELSRYTEEELKKIGARGYKVAGQSIQLAHIMKNSTSMKLCMEWLEFLMELVGRNNLPDILSYYEELGWITEEVRMELMRYAEGIDFYMEKPDWKLTPDDHVKSIWFIENLAGIKVDKNKLSIIDRDIEKVKKGQEIYNI